MTFEPVEPRNGVWGVPRYTAQVAWTGDAGYWADDYPLEALGYDEPAYVARTLGVDPSRTWLVGTLPEVLPVRLLTLVGHNLSTVARFRLRLYSTAADFDADTPAVDMTDDVFLQDEAFPIRRWESKSFWNGKPSPEDLVGFRWSRPIWLPETYRIKAFRLDLVDDLNPDGYLQIGVMDVTWGWQVTENYEWGGQYGLKINSKSEDTDAGVLIDERRSTRQRRVRWSGMPRDEIQARALRLLRQNDIVRPVVFLPDPGAPMEWVHQVLYARVVPQSLFSEEMGNTVGFDWLLEEF